MKLICLSVLLFFSACYKDYINIGLDYDAADFNNDSTSIAFIQYVRVSKPARGLTSFPDGGRPKELYKDVTLFYFNILSDSLTRVLTFVNLPYSKARWVDHISMENGYLAFSIYPAGGWNNELNNNETYKTLNKQFAGIFIYDIAGEKLVRFKNSGYHPVFSPSADRLTYLTNDGELIITDDKGNSKNIKVYPDLNANSIQWINNKEIVYRSEKDWYKINIYQLSQVVVNEEYDIVPSPSAKTVEELIQHVKYLELGIDIQPLLPKGKKALINELVSLKGNENYRKAILQLLEPKLNSNDVQYIFKQIKRHEKGLNDYDGMIYRLAMDSVIKQLKELQKTF